MAERTRRHQEWLDYFRTLVARYQDNPLYPSAASVAWQTMDVIDDAADIDAAKKSIWTSPLLIENPKAVMRDREVARATLYGELDEPVKAYSARTILGALEDIVHPTSLIEMADAVREQVARALAVDAFVACVADDFEALEDIEVWETAEVPARWRAELDARVAAALAEGRRRWDEDIAPAARGVWDGWTLDDRELWGTRHRRRLPFPDHVIERRLGQHRRYRGASTTDGAAGQYAAPATRLGRRPGTATTRPGRATTRPGRRRGRGPECPSTLVSWSRSWRRIGRR